MALNLQSLSLTSAFNSIVAYFKSQENQARWKDLSTNSEGAFLIRLLANVMSTISYRIVAQSRENYLSTAALTSSNVGLAVNLGYSVFRGSNLKRLAYIRSDANYTLPRFSVIGNYDNDHTILTLKEEELIAGEVTKVETVVGNLKEETFVAGTSDTKIFTLFTSGISEDFKLLKDNVEVPTTKIIKELEDDKYLVRTNPYSSVDIIYLNTSEQAKYKYGTGTEFTIQYVELEDVTVIPYTSDMFTYGTLEDVATISNYLPFESVESIKVNAPLQHETQNLIRSKKDYANRLRQIIPSVIETSYQPITPTYTQTTYLKNNNTLLTGSRVFVGSAAENDDKQTNTEVAEVKEILKNENFFGTPLPDIVPPRREVAALNISMALTNKYKNISEINLDIDNILSNYYSSKLAMSFNTFELERRIEELSYVKYARVSYEMNERQPSTNYQLGYLIENNGKYYKAAKILGYTGEQEPADGWGVPVNPGADIDTNIVVKDGSIYWRCYKRLPNMSALVLTRREPSMQYGLGDFMYLDLYPNYMFKCVDIVRESSSVMPDTTALTVGDFVVDGGIVWVVKDKISEAPTWESLHQYQLGETVNGTGQYSLECISYTGYTGSNTNMAFEKEAYEVIEQTLNTFTVEGDVTFYFRNGDVITGTYEGGYTTFEVVSSIATGGNTVITVRRFQDGEASEEVVSSEISYETLIAPQRGTKDGSILWELIDDPSSITYSWNSFVSFSKNIVILEN